MHRADDPSPQLVLQRVRNRVIEYLEVAASFERQREYQAAAPTSVSVPHEVIEQWADWVHDPGDRKWAPPIFSSAERAAIVEFHAAWSEVAAATPDPLPPLEATLRLPAWERLRAAAEQALAVVNRRGKLPEEHEI